MEVDIATLDYIVKNVTNKLLEPVSTPLNRRRASFMPPPSSNTTTINTQETQDSMFFPPIDEVGQLQASNFDLKKWIGALVE